MGLFSGSSPILAGAKQRVWTIIGFSLAGVFVVTTAILVTDELVLR